MVAVFTSGKDEAMFVFRFVFGNEPRLTGPLGAGSLGFVTVGVSMVSVSAVATAPWGRWW